MPNFSIPLSGLTAESTALAAIANNLANQNTTGYRGQQPTFSSLVAATSFQGDELSDAVNNFNVLSATHIDLNPAELERTGNPLDLGIEGNGFFAVETGTGVVYTRNGNFQVDPSGILTNRRGEPVLGEQGPISIPSGAVAISADGTISVNGAIVNKLQVVEFTPGSMPLAAGNSNYSGASVRLSPDSAVRQGMLEVSNVNAMTAVTDLISVQRRAEMLERAMSLFHGNLNHIAASELPRV